MILTIIILSILLCASMFANYNLLKKLENVEDDNDYMMDWINKLSSQTSHILKQISFLHISSNGGQKYQSHSIHSEGGSSGSGVQGTTSGLLFALLESCITSS